MEPPGDRRFVNVQMLGDELGWRMRQPVGERELLVARGSEYADELQFGIADIFDIVSEISFDVADVAGSEVHRQRFGTRIEDSHAAFALDIVLPLVGVWVPMHLPYASRWNGDQGCRHSGGNVEIGTVGNADRAIARFPGRTG
jgi:hypothetical protein